MSFTREQWAKDLLIRMGNPIVNQQVIDWIVGWTVFETNTNSGAKFNLLNTTQPMPGATDFNSVGVKNYTSYAQGIQATQLTLQNGRYGFLSQALFTNDIKSLNPPSAGVQSDLHTWCGGCGYGANFSQTGPSHLNDAFTYGDAQSVTGQSSAGQNTLTSGPSFSDSQSFDWLSPQFVGKMSVGIGLVIVAIIFLLKGEVR